MVVLAAGALVIASLPSWWWGPRVEVWHAARSFVDAVRDGDCASAVEWSTIVTSSVGCSPRSYGLPERLSGYSLSMDWFGLERDPSVVTSTGPEAALGLTVPGVRHDYSLSLGRRGGSWAVTGVIVFV